MGNCKRRGNFRIKILWRHSEKNDYFIYLYYSFYDVVRPFVEDCIEEWTYPQELQVHHGENHVRNILNKSPQVMLETYSKLKLN